MVQRQTGRRQLAHTHHVARYCRPRDIAVDGIPEEGAFRLRPGEAYLSTNWLEYFHVADRPAQLDGVRQALAGKGFRMSRAARFAVLNVGAAADRCRDLLDAPIRFIALGEPHDPSHTGIYGYTAHNTAVAAALAGAVAPNALHPAII